MTIAEPSADDLLERASYAAKQPAATLGPEIVESGGPLEQIRKLAVLHTDGTLSDIEFQAKKHELLARL
jgi:hypothetical protein